MMRAVLLGVWIAIALAGCGGVMEPVARDTFRRALYCPDASIASRHRSDLCPYDYAPDDHPSRPDATVMADPERRAEWERSAAEHRAQIERAYSLYEVQGCGSRLLYLCHGSRLGSGCSQVATVGDDGALTRLF